MSCGREFVETLRKIGYPRADALSGEDFDWLCESADGGPFLRWFCGAVSERNVLSAEELRAFGALRAAGKPVLDGTALDAALGTRGAPSPRASARDGRELRELQAELEALQRLKALRLRRRNQTQRAASAARLAALELSAREGSAAAELRRGRAVLGAASAQLTRELRALADAVANLTAFLSPPCAGPEAGPPALLHQLSLEEFLRREERSTAALAAFARGQFAQGARRVLESSTAENFQLLDLQAPSPCDSENALEERRLELARLQLAYVCAQHQLVRLRASTAGMEARVRRAEESLRGPAGSALGKDHLNAKISSLNSQILKLEEQITHMKEKTLPAVVKENAQLLNMPVVKGDFDLQIAKQDYYTARQELVLNHLIKQKASFELLQLSYEIELRKHRDIHRQLENLVQELNQSNKILHQRLEMLADPLISQQINPRNIMIPRIILLTEGENKKKELFITHENLEEVAEKLKQDVSLVQDRLAISAREHSFFLSKLNSDVDLLCDVLYQGGNQLLLSDQELKEQFHQVESQLNKLNHLLTDILADVKTKRKILASNKLHQIERELYVYFLKDEDHLKNIVEELENQSKFKTVGLEE